MAPPPPAGRCRGAQASGPCARGGPRSGSGRSRSVARAGDQRRSGDRASAACDREDAPRTLWPAQRARVRLLDQMELNSRTRGGGVGGRVRRAAAGDARTRCVVPAGSPSASPSRSTCPASGSSYPARRLCLLRLDQARQARRGHHRDARGGAAALEGAAIRPGEVHLPGVRGDLTGAAPFHVLRAASPARACSPWCCSRSTASTSP